MLHATAARSGFRDLSVGGCPGRRLGIRTAAAPVPDFELDDALRYRREQRRSISERADGLGSRKPKRQTKAGVQFVSPDCVPASIGGIT
jgi:hypothetical protein